MKRRNALKWLSSLAALFVVRPASSSPNEARHDFSTDDGLRRAVESIFADVCPVQSLKAYENDRFHHITFALKGPIGHEEEVREAVYFSILHNAAKIQGDYIQELGAKKDSTMVWRMFPETDVDHSFDGHENHCRVVARLSWWRHGVDDRHGAFEQARTN